MRTGWGYLISGKFVDQSGESREFASAQWSPHDVGPGQLKESVLTYLKIQYPEVDTDLVRIMDFCWTDVAPVQDTGQDMS